MTTEPPKRNPFELDPMRLKAMRLDHVVLGSIELDEHIRGIIKIAQDEGLSDMLIAHALISEAKFVLQQAEDQRPDGETASYELTVNLLRTVQAVLDGEASGELVGY
jgi:hypothetical protein